jgi:hypothetical protein
MRNELLGVRPLIRLLAILVLGVVLAACGGEDADDEPAATTVPSDAQPTAVIDDEVADESTPGTSAATAVPENIDMSAVSPDPSPGDDATPRVTAVGGVTTDATPEGAIGVGAGTPVTTIPDPAVASPDAEADGEGISIPAAPEVGDGTTGAFVLGTPETAADATPLATPGIQDDPMAATPVASPASPVPDASPVASVSVTGCDVTDVPEFAGEQTSWQATTELNFRTGPGADCDLALDEPLDAFQVVEVVGGPVTREDDDSEWVQVRVLDTDGWVAFEFLEAVED